MRTREEVALNWEGTTFDLNYPNSENLITLQTAALRTTQWDLTMRPRWISACQIGLIDLAFRRVLVLTGDPSILKIQPFGRSPSSASCCHHAASTPQTVRAAWFLSVLSFGSSWKWSLCPHKLMIKSVASRQPIHQLFIQTKFQFYAACSPAWPVSKSLAKSHQSSLFQTISLESSLL